MSRRLWTCGGWTLEHHRSSKVVAPRYGRGALCTSRAWQMHLQRNLGDVGLWPTLGKGQIEWLIDL